MFPDKQCGFRSKGGNFTHLGIPRYMLLAVKWLDFNHSTTISKDVKCFPTTSMTFHVLVRHLALAAWLNQVHIAQEEHIRSSQARMPARAFVA